MVGCVIAVIIGESIAVSVVVSLQISKFELNTIAVFAQTYSDVNEGDAGPERRAWLVRVDKSVLAPITDH